MLGAFLLGAFLPGAFLLVSLFVVWPEDVGGDDDVDGEEEDVSEANILVSEASKLSAGARIFRGP